ncbi:flagellar hook-basal body complex protein FliE [Paenisporosarcina sp. FSL H8-0542]|uniref:flagellar hook-basal body complex protein FliE n=1 Tax=unclassified Paenisporosarcina TaxID=2642018 RepID=UPI00034E0880|nr:flagellar hook-basal body complex protein FliE [Paenisporosarcina sp. HGH0030]EPD49609.1 flagellar hook-basal body complex protein FliE [Paenisporosarcina sp. HGH0030]
MDKLSLIQTPFIQNQSISKQKPEDKVEGFGQLFKQKLEEVNTAQNTSDKLTNQLVTGEVKDVHEVMIASQKASLSLQLTVQVRNKVVEAYQEVMRMQL